MINVFEEKMSRLKCVVVLIAISCLMCLKYVIPYIYSVHVHAQLVGCLPGTQNVTGLSPARGSSSFSLGKKELSSGVVAWICLVSMIDYTSRSLQYLL